MTITYPYPLASLADLLSIESVTWDIQRNDQFSGTGDGRVWQAELASPLWSATVALNVNYSNELKQIAARIRKLHGAQESFFLYDPLSKYPQLDPDGSILGAATVQILALASGRDGVSMKGLPAGYTLLPGDKFSLSYGTSPVKYGFYEVSEPVQAAPNGQTPVFAVFPHLPVGVAADAAITLIKPACRCIIMPGSHNPGSASSLFTSGAAFKVLQKK